MRKKRRIEQEKRAAERAYHEALLTEQAERTELVERASVWDNPHQQFIAASDTMRARLEADPILQALNVRVREKDEKVTLKTNDGLQAYWVARGGFIDSSQVRERVFEVKRDTVGFNIAEFTEHLTPNKVDEITEYGFKTLRDEIVRRSVRLLQVGAEAKTRNFDQRSIAMLSQITDPGGKVTVIGSHAGCVNAFHRGIRVIHLFGDLAKELPNSKVWAFNEDCFSLNLWLSRGKVFDETDGEYTHWLHRVDIGMALMAPSLKLRT